MDHYTLLQDCDNVLVPEICFNDGNTEKEIKQEPDTKSYDEPEDYYSFHTVFSHEETVGEECKNEQDNTACKKEQLETMVFVDMSLHPTPSQEVDPLLLNIVKTEETKVAVNAGENFKLCYKILIKEEVDLNNGCDMSLLQTEQLSEKSESIIVQDEVSYDVTTTDGTNGVSLKEGMIKQGKNVSNQLNGNNSISILKTRKHVNTGTKLHKCTYCEKVFRNLSCVKNHEKIHSAIKLHKCKYCEKTFRKLYNRKIHENIHAGIKPHKCKYCEMGFSRLDGLKNHENKHTGIKPHICNYCQKTFSHFGNLKTHENVHTGIKPYKCKYCQKTFSHIGNLKTHENVHNGIKPHKCKYCEKAFSQLRGLRVHENLHIGIKPHQCKFCERPFSRLADLKRHENIHTRAFVY